MPTRRRPRIVRWLALALAAALLGPLTAHAGAPAHGAQTPIPPSRQRAGEQVWTVTLLTGDRVRVQRDRVGRQTASVLPASGRPEGRLFRKLVDLHHDVHVVPLDVLPLLGRVLDPALFNVSELIRERDDDAHANALPLIVQQAARSAGTPLAVPLTGGRTLHSLGAVAGRHPKASARRLGVALAGAARAPGKAGTTGVGGVAHIWLNRKVHASAATTRPELDHDLTQIGAPAAWAAGLSGRGVTVAVLDTGVDTTHPDLAGKVAASQDFSGSGSTADHLGHGTHVAATIAGTGAAAAGARKGVAFGATLLNGKVLGDDGFGTEDQVIAGMEWAAAQHARIVNLSLGSDEPSDGSDPLSQAVDRLTASAQTLFVVAAGNTGPYETTIGSPAAAEAALTVGAVAGDDRLAGFSSRGPRLGDRAIKPDLTAPGVDIVEARATGTGIGLPIDRFYTSLSGTSMATPHVAGAAAILAQRHPDWSPGRLKATLAATATPMAGTDAYQGGAGRVDIHSALAAAVVAGQSTVSLGTFAWPQTGAAPVARGLSWSNPGARPVTLDLGVRVGPRGSTAPPGVTRLSASALTLPPGGEGAVTLTIDPAAASRSSGLYQGEVTATPRGGSAAAALRTPVAFYEEPPSFDLTVTTTPLPGTAAGAASGSVDVVNLDDSSAFAQFFIPVDAPGTSTIRVPQGHYSVLGTVTDANPKAPRAAQVGAAEVDVHADTTVRLDATRARPLDVQVAGVVTETAWAWVDYQRTTRHGEPWQGDLLAGYPYTKLSSLLVQPTAPVSVGSFDTVLYTRLRAPQLTMAIDGAPAPLAPLAAEFSPLPADGTRHLAVVDAGQGSAAELAGLDVRGKLVVVAWTGAEPAEQYATVQRAADAGAAIVAFANDSAGPLVPVPVALRPDGRGLLFPTILTVGVSLADATRLRAAAGDPSATVAVTGRLASPFMYDLAHPAHDRFPTDPDRTVTAGEQRRLARLDERFAALEGQAGTISQDARFIVRDGRLVNDATYTEQPVPATRVDYVSADDTMWSHSVVINRPNPDPFFSAAMLNAFRPLAPGSRQMEWWARQPLYPGPDDLPPDSPAISFCQGPPIARTHGNLRVWLDDDRDGPDRYGCLGDSPDEFDGGLITSTVRVFQDGVQIGSATPPISDFTIASKPATYQLVLDNDQSQVQPVTTRTSTVWTFRSAPPSGNQQVPVPMLLVDYQLPLDLENHPSGDQASLTVHRQHGVPAPTGTGLAVWTSTDDGATWTAAPARKLSDGRFQATLPTKPPGTWVSLRVDARDDAGGRIQQTIVRAYRTSS